MIGYRPITSYILSLKYTKILDPGGGTEPPRLPRDSSRFEHITFMTVHGKCDRTPLHPHHSRRKTDGKREGVSKLRVTTTGLELMVDLEIVIVCDL